MWKDDDSWLDGIIKGLVAVPVLAGKTAADGWDAATGFGQSVVGGVQQGVEVGRSMISSGIGLVTNAGRGFMSFVGGFKDRLVSLIESAWNQIWDSITTTFQLVLDGMADLVKATAQAFKAGLELTINVGRWLVDGAMGLVAFIREDVLPWVLAKALVVLANLPLAGLFVVFIGRTYYSVAYGALALVVLPFDPKGGLDLFEDSFRAGLGASGRASRRAPRAGDEAASLRNRGSATPLSDYTSAIGSLDAGEVVVQELGGAPPRYVILVRGLDIGSLGSQDVLSALETEYTNDSPLIHGLEQILDSLPADAQVAMIGHSLGGMASARVASDPRVSHLVAIGSPVEGKVPADVKTLNIAERGDPVEKIDRDDGDSLGAPPSENFVNLDFDHPDVDHFAAHGIGGSYVEAIDALEGRQSDARFESEQQRSAAEEWLSDFQSTFSPGERSTTASVFQIDR